MPENIAALGEEGWRARGWLPCVDVDQRVEGEDYADPEYEWDEREGRRILRTIPAPQSEDTTNTSGGSTSSAD
jgi:hypothetical protein